MHMPFIIYFDQGFGLGQCGILAGKMSCSWFTLVSVIHTHCIINQVFDWPASEGVRGRVSACVRARRARKSQGCGECRESVSLRPITFQSDRGGVGGKVAYRLSPPPSSSSLHPLPPLRRLHVQKKRKKSGRKEITRAVGFAAAFG